MSTTITVGTGTEEIHGSLAGAQAHVDMMLGEAAETWDALDDDDKKKTLAMAVRFLNSQVWRDTADTFAERDAIEEFEEAQYELAVMIAGDPEVVAEADQGSNISDLKAGSASISFFNQTSARRGTASVLPPVLMRLVGSYLAASTNGGPVGGSGQSGSCRNPMSDCSDNDRDTPY